jgi:PKD repeat protein
MSSREISVFVTIRRAFRHHNRLVSALAATTLVASAAAAVTVAAAAPAGAAVVVGPVSPVANRNPATQVTADVLPTVQMDGVAWSQAIVGNTVWVGGQFSNARPAGAAAGTQQVTRNNLLAYNLTTGALITSIAPNLNAQVKSVVASPDGTRIYVGGAFTTVNGVAHSHIAAFDATTGALISSFKGSTDASVYALAATNTTVYAGGAFSRGNGQPHSHLAAFNTSGSVLAWNPSANYDVNALTMTRDGQKLVVGGGFTQLNNAAALGLGAVDPATGATLTWNVANVVHDSQPNAAILSLTTDAAGNVYGAGFVYGASGNLEGTFSANQTNGDVNWIEDCHGDTYGVSATASGVYIVGHAHFCGNIGGFPQTSPTWTFHRALAFTPNPTGYVQHNSTGNYYDWAGYPSPSLVNWFPNLAVGSITGKSQAAWTVASNDKYVVLGGEFPKVNGQAQQGLVRFALKSLAPNKRGPQLYSAADTDPSVVSLTPGTMRVSFPTNWDQDDMALTYKVYRNSLSSTPVYTKTVNSTFWKMPRVGFTDTGLTPGQTYKYRVQVTDPDGNLAQSYDWVSGTVLGGTAATSAYSTDVVNDGASQYWPLNESGGNTAFDNAGFDDMTEYNAVTHGTPGSNMTDSETSSSFDGSSAYAADSTATQGPDVFSIEAWFKTTSTSGGKIIGFGNANSGLSTSYDRHMYVDSTGHAVFGVYNGASYTVTSPNTVNDGQWHYAVGTLSPSGMTFYLDGKRVGTNGGTTVGQAYQGYWRIGGDSAWSGNAYFNGAIDDVAVYPSALSLTQVRQHYLDSGRTVGGVPTPTDTYGKAVVADSPDLYYRLGDSTTTAVDSSGNGNNGTYYGSIQQGVSSPVTGTSDTAATFSGTNGSDVASAQSFNDPTTYSEELWFKTTTTNGGKLIGFGSSQTGGSNNYDRHVYMEPNGQLTFGVWTGTAQTTTSPKSYNDGQWHYLVATQGPNGMKLYVDDALVGTNPTTGQQAYTGYWRIGGDNTWNGTSYFAGTIDEAAVYSSALTANQVDSHYKASPLGPQNQNPTASFTATPNNLSVSVDGSASSDPDGTVASYSWNWGDGTPADSGATASHTYAAGGQYTITLTVTDNNGGTGTTTRSVTVTAPNQNPTASFTATPNGLAVSVDGSASSDPDGTVASYSWNWGDGTAAGTGATASHTYASGGSYPIALTVTDNRGGQDTTTQTVTVAQGAVASDGFGRTVTGAWGSADIGGPWTLTGSASRFKVDGSVGQMTIPTAGATDTALLSNVSQQDVNELVDLRTDQMTTGSGLYCKLIARSIGKSDYRLIARLMPGGVVHLALARVIDGTSTNLGEKNISTLTWAAGDILRMRFTVTTQAGTSTLAGSIWKTSDTEPASPQFTMTDSTAALQAPGGVGLSTFYASNATDAPITASYDNFSVKTG